MEMIRRWRTGAEAEAMEETGLLAGLEAEQGKVWG